MKVPHYRILVIDDNSDDSGLVERQLGGVTAFTAEVARASAHEEGLRRLEEHGAECVVLDYRLGAECGLRTLRAIRDRGDDTAVVFVTGAGSETLAVAALQCGAQDYLVKSVLAPEALQRAISNAVEKVALSRQIVEKRRELEDFVSVVAHDLQQPLCAVKGNIELIRDFYAGRLDEQGVEFVDAAIRTSTRMAEMIEALLGYARVGRDGAPVDKIDLNEVIAGVRHDLAGLIARSRATVEAGPLPAVSGDPVTLGQLFQNLIANAVKFRGEQLPEIVIGGGRAGDWVTLWVRDNGMGMPAGSLDKIFAPFRRLPQAKDLPGSGIGLATCKKIASQHGGRIWVESELGKGSTFFVTLRAPEQRLERRDALGPSRVLLVDPEPEAGYRLARPLARRQMAVEPVVGVQQASHRMARERFDALVVDLALGDGDSLELIRHVRRYNPGVAVLAVAAGDGIHGPGPLLARALREGAHHVLPKPLDGAQVAALLQRMIAETTLDSAI